VKNTNHNTQKREEIKDIELDRRQMKHYAVAQHIVPTEISLVLSHSAEKR
jgi:hypothetical protein